MNDTSKASLGLLAVAGAAAVTAYSIWMHQAPAAVPASAPPAEFSAERALEHIRKACTRPHPAGTEANEQVMEYLLETLRGWGLHPQVQETTIVRALAGRPVRPGTTVGRVKNVTARLRGTASRHALLMMAHYDSVAWGPGAADDWAGCATLLETLRALRAGPALRNDVIFLFADAEEEGLLGAHAFVNEHPWLADVKVVANFDVRGTAGPAYMFETGGRNGWVVREFLRAVRAPVANSMMADAYRLMPLSSDFNVFRDSGFQGLNFAFIRGLAYYHTAKDAPENSSPASVQHMGDCALQLARHFGNLPLSGQGEPDAVYFSVTPWLAVRYPAAWVAPLAALTLLALALLLCRDASNARPLALAAAGVLAAGLAGAAAVALLISPVWILRGFVLAYDNDLYLASSGIAALAAALWVLGALGRRLPATAIYGGAMLWWMALLVVTAFISPGVTFIFQWPLVFAMIGALAMLPVGGREAGPLRCALGALLAAAPSALVAVPVLHGLGDALTALLMAPGALLVAMLAALLAPAARFGAGAWRRRTPLALALIALAIWAAALLQQQNTSRRPGLVSLAYAWDADTGRAFWLSRTRPRHEWTRQFFASGLERASVSEFLPGQRGEAYRGPAPPAPLAPMEVTVLEDVRSGGRRRMRLRLVSPMRATRAVLQLSEGATVVSSRVAGKPYAAGRPWRLQLRALREPPLEVELELRASSAPVQLTVWESRPELPAAATAPFAPRPASLMPEPNTVPWVRRLPSFFTIVRKTHTLETAAGGTAR